MSALRVALIGCVDSSLAALQALLSRPDCAELVGVLTRRHSSVNSDFADLAPLARAHGLPVLCTEDAPDDDAQAAWLRARRPDVVLCIGWSRLLGPALLTLAPHGVVGFHPAALPANRGRHPLVWALALGLPSTASSFFRMEAEADSGAILSQRPIRIDNHDDAASLYAKVLAEVPAQLEEILTGLRDGTLRAQPQDPALANHWRKRGKADGQIDWRMDARAVYNLTRALARPYPGAHFLFQGQEVKLWKCAVVEQAPTNLEPGKVLAVQDGRVLVKCGRGAVWLLEHELGEWPAVGDYV